MAQKGFEYEENAYNALQKYDISTGGVAKALHDKPDLTIKRKNKTTGVELKNSPTAAGSLVMKYYEGKWDYGDYEGAIEKKFLHDMAEEKNLLTEMNIRGIAGSRWRGKIPHLQNDDRGKKIIVPPKLDKRKAYEQDIKKFGGQNEVHIAISAKMICDYYIAKKCSYINVGTHGFFTLNGKDSLELNEILFKNKLKEIPDFAEAATSMIRVRCQPKRSGGGDYQFAMTMQFSILVRSPYNIAPLMKGSTSSIDVTALKKDSLLLAFT